MFGIILLGIVAGLVYTFRKKIAKFFSADESQESTSSHEESEALIVRVSGTVAGRSKEFSSITWANTLSFTLNGEKIEVVNPDPEELLAGFLREKRSLKGTKLGCEEGGCGACSVVLQYDNGHIVSANSCLRLLCANDGLSITTVEGIGSVSGGLSIEQSRLVGNNGTQCGYCTPGWITNMHALLQDSGRTGKNLDPADVEKHFDGNICRCTGYRPILQAFHSLCNEQNAKNCHKTMTDNCSRIGDLEDITGVCQGIEKPGSVKSNKSPAGSSVLVKRSKTLQELAVTRPLHFYNPATNKRFFRPINLFQLTVLMKEYSTEMANSEVKFMGGNTSIGVTKYLNNSSPWYIADDVKVIIDINKIFELNVQNFNDRTNELILGSAVKLTDFIAILHELSTKVHKTNSNLSYVNHNSVFSVAAHHLYRVANTVVRNAASWAGNLAIFLKYRSFPSDVVVALATANATIQLTDSRFNRTTLSLKDFMNLSYEEFCAKGYVIVSVTLKESQPVQNHRQGVITVADTHKVALREKNAHAYVQGGYFFEINASYNPPLCLNASIVVGGVSKKSFIAQRTQAMLANQPMNSSVFQQALVALQQDVNEYGGGINAESSADANFLLSTMQNYLYLAFLRCYNYDTLPVVLKSALLPWAKPISRGAEVFPINKDDTTFTPVGKPIKKLEGPIQATGEAVYSSDEQVPRNGYFAVLVFATECAKVLTAIDASQALAVPGVIGVFTAADVPGANDLGNGLTVFVSIGSVVPCVGYPVAVVIAETEQIATKAVPFVRVSYDQSTAIEPVVNLEQAMTRNSFYETPDYLNLSVGTPSDTIKTAPNRLQGRLNAAGQYHFYMEAQTAIATPSNGGEITIKCGTQDPTYYMSQIAAVLNVPSNQVTISCERVGGAFGGKIRSGMSVASIAAVCAQKLKKTVRIFNHRTWDMNMQGGREDWIADYDVGFDSNGVVTSLIWNYYLDAGCAMDDAVGAAFMGTFWGDNAYYFPNYAATMNLAFTNTPARTSMRAPGVVHSCFFTECVMGRIANALGLPMNVVQERNFLIQGETTINGDTITTTTLQDIWSKIMKRSHYQTRLQYIQQYNSQNLWRKKGIAICPSKYGIGWAGYNAGVRIGVRQSDGTVVVTHSGCEIGQGINTKVAQAVAMALQIDLSLIKVERTNSHAVLNGGTTGGSGTSESMVQAALNACATLNGRLDPYRPTDNSKNKINSLLKSSSSMPTSDWLALLGSLPYDVSLNVEGWFSPNSNTNGQPMFQYYVYAACLTEIELNVLTGEVHVLASEVIYDCGQSLNPAIDVGQIEGAIIMTLGWFFQEKVEYTPGTGVLKTVGTWEYKPPISTDIPSVFTVTMLKNDYNKDGILGSKVKFLLYSVTFLFRLFFFSFFSIFLSGNC
jgi:xanthine dehydrogenase/oxidase